MSNFPELTGCVDWKKEPDISFLVARPVIRWVVQSFLLSWKVPESHLPGTLSVLMPSLGPRGTGTSLGGRLVSLFLSVDGLLWLPLLLMNTRVILLFLLPWLRLTWTSEEYMDPFRSSDMDQSEFSPATNYVHLFKPSLCSFCSLMFCRFLLKFLRIVLILFHYQYDFIFCIFNLFFFPYRNSVDFWYIICIC